jgi:glycosyltransferase involved in cell wall biosynthesis
MRVLVNALSATNISARHVLLGHLSNLAKWTSGKHEYFVIYHALNKDICKELGDNVHWVKCPVITAHWFARVIFETLFLNRLVSKLSIDFLFSPAGTIIYGISVPQVSFAQNPWFLINWPNRSLYGNIKSFVQRHNYKQAMRLAKMMIFNSEYMRDLYRKTARFKEKDSEIVYQAVDNTVHEIASKLRGSTQRKPYQILCVSHMASHKGVETVVRAVHKLNICYKVPAQLYLIGPWTDFRYQRKIFGIIKQLKLNEKVFMSGRVSEEELYRYYSESKVFCLMSWCESFSIPTVEAQAFGLPVVASNSSAIPEIGGEGGLYAAPQDVDGAAEALFKLLTDNQYWCSISQKAIENSKKYQWDTCSKPMLKMFNILND